MNEQKMVCGSFGDLLSNLCDWRAAGHVVQVADDPQLKTCGFKNANTGQVCEIPLTRLIIKTAWFKSKGASIRILKRLGMNEQMLGDLIKTPAGRQRLAAITPR